ncbi:MAG: deoxyuridine 5'-triphosphate nucleotidohydrolase [Thermoproteota archaeon]
MSGRKIIEMEIVKDLRSVDEQVQPAGIDLTIEKIELLVERGEISNNPKFSKGINILPKNGFYELPQGSYRIAYHEIVNIPPGFLGLLLPRSSLLRNGATIYTAVWDPGYRGRGMGLMVVFNKLGIRIAENARIAQLIVLDVEDSKELYKGRFLGENLNNVDHPGVY